MVELRTDPLGPLGIPSLPDAGSGRRPQPPPLKPPKPPTVCGLEERHSGVGQKCIFSSKKNNDYTPPPCESVFPKKKYASHIFSEGPFKQTLGVVLLKHRNIANEWPQGSVPPPLPIVPVYGEHCRPAGTVHSKVNGLKIFQKVKVDLIAPDEIAMPKGPLGRREIQGGLHSMLSSPLWVQLNPPSPPPNLIIFFS